MGGRAEGRAAREAEARRRALEHATLMDDGTMRAFFRGHPELAQLVVRALTGLHDIRVTEMETQRDLGLPGTHGARLDIWATDADGREYDIEVQNGSTPDARRARFYSAGMDLAALAAGRAYAELPESYVVFVMSHDPYGRGDATYRFDRAEVGRGGALGDGTHIIYANMEYAGDGALGDLLHDFSCADPEDMRVPELRERMRYLKHTERGAGEMAGGFEEYGNFMRELLREEYFEQGLEEGRSEAVLAAVRSMGRNLGLTAGQAMDALEVPPGERAHYLAML